MFDEALKAMLPSAEKTEGGTQQGMNFCNQLYSIERELKEVTPQERHDVRQERSLPVLDAFLVWLKQQRGRTLPKSATGKDITYRLNQWDKLIGFTKDGRLEIDNNHSDRAIKPFVIGRKNWLFANTARGAKASATIYSVMETAKENGLNLFQFEQLPQLTDLSDPEALDKLLPWSQTLPLAY
eukprot:gnl/Spiro4/4165_TR2081_c0_g2_i1.p2 gnl/Spiro4/4165_TR2081_c0_g2~~gnl/Spiro4/4165_TR2081_c0_g2_i1.p2  ORF type:complete len:183 (-),score=7.74 gnl/Spiro4/4165_TR2081_c0_g2_i1:1542-2090(-)